MNLIEVMCSVVLLAFFFGICASVVRPLEKNVRETAQVSTALERDKFIVRSFRTLCEKNGEKSHIEDWCRFCNALYPGKSISVARAGFDDDGHLVFSCAWQTERGQQKVFASQKQPPRQGALKE